jgi:predicted lipid-binding transport protein (Tim44 family)
MRRTVLAGGVLLTLTALLALDLGEAWARARGGGSRGSRTFSAPARPAPTSPASPMPGRAGGAEGVAAPAPARPGLGGGLLGGLAGFALGGLLGGLLFGGLGHMGGIGLFDLLLLGGGLMLLMAWMRRRREAATPAPAYAGVGAPAGPATASSTVGTMERPAPPAADPARADLDRGLGHIGQMDARFDPTAMARLARAFFPEVQRAVAARDAGPLRDRLAPEMYGVLQRQCERLRAAHEVDHVEGVDVREADVTEAWQETGRDFVTVRLAGSLVDYTVNERTGAIVEGSRTAQPFEEYWTFTRPVGPNAWALSAIQTG